MGRKESGASVVRVEWGFQETHFPAAADSKPFFMTADEYILLQWQK